ncbi:M12 family metallopeptidase [Chitinophaga sancti]|uniref:M12 family metallopeptidase n=1 Tax=Chitinophaga sancti TaxID=1004 RepID=UPI002A755806|nr:M12 family metallopeptidase [Chitinophaga sancti]WPQ66125.1 M12 family metallopeptidase [Chitinophaga sancti]
MKTKKSLLIRPLLLTGLVLAMSFSSCKKQEATDTSTTTTKDCGCSSMEAFPNIKGEPVTITNKKTGEQYSLIKKGDRYLLDDDMVLGESQVKFLKGETDDATARTGRANFVNLWPNRIVYYSINVGLPNSSRVTDAIAHWQANTNIQFVQRTNQANYIEFIKDDGCYSDGIGMTGGKQLISLDDGCSWGNAVHEIGHALGFFHEQTRADRDNYVIINWSNIEDDEDHNFQTYAARGYQGFELGTFDWESIMLYGPYFFSKNGSPTITTLGGGTYYYNSSVLSSGDIQTYNYMYNPGIYAKMVQVPIEYQWNDGPNYLNVYEAVDVYIRFYSDAACTVPANLSFQTNVTCLSSRYTYGGSGGANSETVSYHKLAPGSNSYKIVDLYIKQAWEQEYGNYREGGYYQDIILQNGVGYIAK